jgi:formamidopyrimidine-DNA glycosylase
VPELPEVEVVRLGLAAVSGARVASVTIFDERSLRRHAGPSEDFVDRLTGRTLLHASRRGKFLWLPLLSEIQEKLPNEPAGSPESRATDAGTPAFRTETSGGRPQEALVVHLGMSGQVLLRERGTDDPRTRIRIDLDDPEHGALWLNFVDQRIFGSMAIDELLPALDAPEERIPRSVSHIARDPLDPHFDDRRFLAALARRNTAIKRVLLDQNLLSGIGNIYADEALWAARIHYDQPAASLSQARAKLLLAEVRLVLAKALVEGGTSFDAQYVNVNGASGYFAHSLNVYGRQGEACARCGRPVIREKFMNRGSHFCPFCQRLRMPRAPNRPIRD